MDWHRGRLDVRSPKTERHAGHEQRAVPLTADLLPILREAFDAAPDGAVDVLPRNRSNEYVRQRLHAAIKRAEVELWDDLFRTLRSSCERESALTFPQYAVSKWIGHGIAVSGKHYTHGDVPAELFERAAEAESGAQNPAQQAHAPGRTSSQLPGGRGTKSAEPADFAGVCVAVRDEAHVYGDATRRANFGPSSRRSAAPGGG